MLLIFVSFQFSCSLCFGINKCKTKKKKKKQQNKNKQFLWHGIEVLPVGCVAVAARIDCLSHAEGTEPSSPWTANAISSGSVCNVRSNSDTSVSVPDVECWHTERRILWPFHPNLPKRNYHQ